MYSAMEIQNKYHYYIDSSRRISGTNTDFTIDIPNLPQNIDRVVVLAASIPKTYYLFTNDNTFTLNEGELSVVISLTPGNFTIYELQALLSEALCAYSPNHFTYSVNFNKTTGKYTYLVTGNTLQPSFTMNDTNIYNVMGFGPNTTNNFTNDTLESLHIISANREATLFIHSDVCQNPSGDSILQEIFTTQTTSNSYISFQNPNPIAYSKYYFPGKSVFRFYLCDESENNIDLNGINMNLTLLFYRADNISEYVMKFMKLLAYELHKKNNNLAELI